MINKSEEKNIIDDEISLKDLILSLKSWTRYLFANWIIIVLAGIIGGVLGLLYAHAKKPVYIATLSFALVERHQGSVLDGYAGLANQFGINVGGSSDGVFSENNIMDLMKSRLMISKTFLSGANINGENRSLANYYIDINKLHERWKLQPTLNKLSFLVNLNLDSLSYFQDSVMNEFYSQIIKNNLSVDKLDKNSSIIIVQCSSNNELFSKYFTETLVKNVASFYINTKTKLAANNVNILQDRLDSIKHEFNKALFSSAEVSDQNFNPGRAIVNVPRVKSQADVQILETEYAELTKDLEMSKLALLQETPLIQVIDKPILPLKTKKISRLKGIIFGFLSSIILIIVFLTLKRMFKTLAEDSPKRIN